MYKQVSTDRLYEGVASQLEELILSGELKPGDRLDGQRELAKRFGVSQPVLREALRVLALRGAIEILPGKGTFVAARTADAVADSLDFMIRRSRRWLADLLEVRESFELAIARLAAERATPGEIDHLQQQVQRMDRSHGDQAALWEHDETFHRALAEATHNQVYASLVSPMAVAIQKVRGLWLGDIPRTVDLHRRIVEAVATRDPEVAAEAMAAHMAYVRRVIEAYLQAEGENLAPGRAESAQWPGDQAVADPLREPERPAVVVARLGPCGPRYLPRPFSRTG